MSALLASPIRISAAAAGLQAKHRTWNVCIDIRGDLMHRRVKRRGQQWPTTSAPRHLTNKVHLRPSLSTCTLRMTIRDPRVLEGISSDVRTGDPRPENHAAMAIRSIWRSSVIELVVTYPDVPLVLLC